MQSSLSTSICWSAPAVPDSPSLSSGSGSLTPAPVTSEYCQSESETGESFVLIVYHVLTKAVVIPWAGTFLLLRTPRRCGVRVRHLWPHIFIHPSSPRLLVFHLQSSENENYFYSHSLVTESCVWWIIALFVSETISVHSPNPKAVISSLQQWRMKSTRWGQESLRVSLWDDNVTK